MTTLLLLENRIVSLEHITQAEFTPAYAGGEPLDENPEQLSSPRPAKLELTLTSVHLDVREYDFQEFKVAGGPESDVVRVLGEEAELAWDWMQRAAIPFSPYRRTDISIEEFIERR